MSLKTSARTAAKQYMLELIERNEPDFIARTSENFGISQSAVYNYLKEAKDLGVVIKINGRYHLNTINSVNFRYTQKNLSSEDEIYRNDLQEYFNSLPENVTHIWEYAVSEMINNVIDHSEATQMSISINQTNLSTTIIIIDDGIGIFKKIMDHFQYDSLDTAIEELFKGKLTTNQQNHSGEGIFFTSRVMDVFFASSDGKIFSHNKYEDVMKQTKIQGSSHGTMIFMKLSNSTNKTLRGIFDEFSNADGGFTKTKIPLSHIFDIYPISRSQAKRLTKRFEMFEEVILDYDGVEDIGQGFAHELYTVFQNANPGVILTSVNTNSNVDRMIYHVTH